MNKVLLQTTCDADMLALKCREYGTSIHGSCPKGAFICPFTKQNADDGVWTIKVACQNVNASDWNAVLEPMTDGK